MRKTIVHRGADELSYEIRGITHLAQRVAACGVDVVWENIGDPIAKGHAVPEWIMDIVAKAARRNISYGYSPTRGVNAARAFLATQRTAEGGATLHADDILFFNGLGDAIAVLYEYLAPDARILGPSPAYPTHSSAEGAHAQSPHLTYTLNPQNNWLPDIDDIRNKVRYNPSIVGILIINPDNPTGMVYPRQTLQDIVAIAREHDLFIVADEIYAHLAYCDEPFVSLAHVIGNIPGIVLRGMSKEVPWPGARCGWAEFYNTNTDAEFARYATALHDAKMLEVCATTLPQTVLPEIYGDERFAQHVKEQRAVYARRAKQAVDIFRTVPHIHVVPPQGAFYLSLVFDNVLCERARTATLPPLNDAVRDVITPALNDVPCDTRCVYTLLAHTGICTVPLSGFNTTLRGIRMTLLERDDDRFIQTCTQLAVALRRLSEADDSHCQIDLATV